MTHGGTSETRGRRSHPNPHRKRARKRAPPEKPRPARWPAPEPPAPKAEPAPIPNQPRPKTPQPRPSTAAARKRGPIAATRKPPCGECRHSSHRPATLPTANRPRPNPSPSSLRPLRASTASWRPRAARSARFLSRDAGGTPRFAENASGERPGRRPGMRPAGAPVPVGRGRRPPSPSCPRVPLRRLSASSRPRLDSLRRLRPDSVRNPSTRDVCVL